MNTTYLIIAVVLALLIVGSLLAVVFSRRKRVQHFQKRLGPEFDHVVQAAGNENKALAELDERRKRVEALDIRGLTYDERARYMADWTAVQAKFVDLPGQAIVDADRLITEVMILRHYPVADFEQRVADISVNYSQLANHYRLAHEIANKNALGQATTEELRQAMIHYRLLFEELLELEVVPR